MLSPTKKALALKLYQEQYHIIEEICSMMGISKSTLNNYLSKVQLRGASVAQVTYYPDVLKDFHDHQPEYPGFLTHAFECRKVGVDS